MVLAHVQSDEAAASAAVFASRYVQEPVPSYELGEKSISKDAAYQIIHDELLLDGSPRLNLASFVTTWMEPECDRLILEGMNKNYADMDEYPVTTELQASYLSSTYIIFFPGRRSLWIVIDRIMICLCRTGA
jgi:glutamate decarboxylase